MSILRQGTKSDAVATHAFLSNDGELGRLVAAFDWSATALGPIGNWPQSLKTTVGLVLRSHVPIVTLWGEDGVMIYNDAYSAFAGGRHPRLLGSKVREGWHEIADFNDNVMKVGLAGGTLAYKDQELTLYRNDRAEQVWMNLDYSPLLDESGTPAGVLAIVIETTQRVLAERRQQAAEAARRDSEAQFRTLAQAIPNQAWTAQADGMLDWFNERVHAYSCAAPGELEGEGWVSIVHPDDVEAVRERWAASLVSGTTYEVEMRIRRADGAWRWHLSRALPIHDAEGRITRWVGTNTDIHEQKLAEAANARDRDRLWAMSQDLMLVCDMEGRITAVNPSAMRLLGWDEAEMVGRTLPEFLHPDDFAGTAAKLAQLSRGAITLAFENRYRTREGTWRLLDWTAVPDGRRIHAVGRDITRERAIARDQERIWTLSPVLKLVANVDGRIAKVNPAWSNALGWSEAETVGRRLIDFVDEHDRATARAAFEQADGRQSEERQLALVDREGTTHHVAWTLVREGDTLYGFGRDVTDQRTAEEALRQSQKMEAVGQLTGGIAHDFNNLLQGITGSLDLVRKRISQGRLGELDRFLAGAMASANRASALTHRLLAFSRRQPLDPRPVRANPLVASMEDLLRRTLGEDVALELALADGLWLTRCDPNQLESAILNLAINARDAMPEGGKLVIETGNARIDTLYAARQRDVRPGQYVCISVTDTGTGMSPDVVSRAFEPFFTTKPMGQGTGLGLSMIYGFARQSEGHAKIYSEPGRGTTFKLYLPRERGEAEEDETPPQLTDAHFAEAGETVLVVEDEAVVRGLIVEVLSDLGYRALEAADGPEGLQILLSRRRIDLLVTDMGLPGLNGRQIADAARERRPDLKVLFMTGYAENAAFAAGFLEPGMMMITKPFAMEVLATRIRKIIGKS